MSAAAGAPIAVVAVAFTVAAGTAAALPPGDSFLITASAAAWAQFGTSGVAPVAKTAPAFLVGPWPTYVTRPRVLPSATAPNGKPVPTHINAIRDAADGTLSVVGLG